MKTLETLFCADHRCDGKQFAEKVFWTCLHRHALPVVPLLGGFQSDYFSSDRELIFWAGKAANLAQVREEISDYFLSRKNSSWLHRKANIRISAKRLARLANQYLGNPDPDAGPGQAGRS